MLGTHDVNGEARVSNGAKEGIQLEVTNELGAGRHDICRVQVIPDVCNFTDSDPMVSFMSDEALLIGHVTTVNSRRTDWRGLDITELLEGLGKHLN